MSVTTEVVDDEEQHVVTAGSIITVTIGIMFIKIVTILMTINREKTMRGPIFVSSL